MAFQKLNKKGFEFQSAFFSIIIFSMFVIAIGIWVNGYNDAYGTGQQSDLDEYDKLDTVSSQAIGQKSQIGASDPDPSDDAEANTYRGVYGVLTNTYSSFDVVFGEEGMLQAMSDRFNIPFYVVQGIIAFIMIAVTFTLVAIIFRLGRARA